MGSVGRIGRTSRVTLVTTGKTPEVIRDRRAKHAQDHLQVHIDRYRRDVIKLANAQINGEQILMTLEMFSTWHDCHFGPSLQRLPMGLCRSPHGSPLANEHGHEKTLRTQPGKFSTHDGRCGPHKSHAAARSGHATADDSAGQSTSTDVTSGDVAFASLAVELLRYYNCCSNDLEEEH